MATILRQALVVSLVTLTLATLLGLCTWAFSSFIEEIYAGYVRDVIQYSCGKVTRDELWYTLRPGKCRFQNFEFDTVVSVDPQGFRNSVTASSPQVVVIGDSMAMGWGVNDDEVFASILQTKLRVPVRNLAISSWATARELAAMVRYAPSARVVVLQYSENDFPENKQYLVDSQYFLHNKEELAKRFEDAQAEFSVEFHKPLLRKIARGVRGVLTMHGGLPAPYRADEASIQDEAKAFRRILDSFAPYLTGKIVVVFESNHFGLNRRTFQSEFQAQLNRIDGVRVIVLDAHSFLGRSHYFTLDDHLNVYGHMEIARRIERALAMHLPNRLPAF